MLRTTFRAAACAALSSALLAVPAAAQIRLIPQVGFYNQFSHLPNAGAGFDDLKKEGSLAYGGAVELGRPDKVSLRLNVLHATESEVPLGPLGCNGSDCARSTVTTATGTLAFRPLPTLILVQPYVLAGGGVKRYDFTKENLQDEGLDAFFNSQNQLTGHLGLGAEVNLGLLRVTAEVSDLISKFDDGSESADSSDTLQHDIFATVGLVIGD